MIGEQSPLSGEFVDLRDGFVVGDLERQHRVGHRAVGNLFVDGEYVPAPVAACTHLFGGVDHDVGAAAGALHRDHCVDVGVDVGGAGTDRGAAEGGEVAVGDGFVEAVLGPFVATEQAHELARRGT